MEQWQIFASTLTAIITAGVAAAKIGGRHDGGDRKEKGNPKDRCALHGEAIAGIESEIKNLHHRITDIRDDISEIGGKQERIDNRVTAEISGINRALGAMQGMIEGMIKQAGGIK